MTPPRHTKDSALPSLGRALLLDGGHPAMLKTGVSGGPLISRLNTHEAIGI